MDWLNSVLSVVLASLSLLGFLIGIVSLIIKRRNNGKPTEVTEELDGVVNVINHSLDIIKLIPDLVVKAEEQYGSGHGASKLEYVLDKLKIYALLNKCDYNEEELTDYVEKIIHTTKTVNVKKEV